MSPDPGGKGVREIASYFLSVIPPPRIGLFRLGSKSLNQTGAAIASSMERAGKRVLLLRSDYQQDGADLIAVRPEGFREGPLVEWKTRNERLFREECASDLLLFLLHPEIPSLPRLLPALDLLVLLLPGDRPEAIGAYRSTKRILVNRRDLRIGLLAAGEGEAAAAVLDRFLLGLRVFLGLRPLNFGATAPTCAKEIAQLKLDSPAQPYFVGNS
jgi:hypothetical protein